MNMRRIAERRDVPPRRMFTVCDIERMSETGLLEAEDRVELTGGELVTMKPRGVRHETLKRLIIRQWSKMAPEDVDFIPQATFRLSEDTVIEPDFLVLPRKVGIRQLPAATALLAVELSDSSIGYDLGAKSLVYAHFGVRELWVIDAVGLKVHVHRDPSEEGYRSIGVLGSTEHAIPLFAPSEFSIRLADLDLSNI